MDSQQYDNRIAFDEQLIKDLGLFVDDDVINSRTFLRIINLIDPRIQQRIVDELNEQQMKEYKLVVGKPDLFNPWVDKYVPDYDSIVQEELDALKREFKDNTADFIKSYKEFINKNKKVIE